MGIYQFEVAKSSGEVIFMSEFENKVILIVNTASKCGFTKQFSQLEALYQKYKEENFVILGFPCNQFMKQEPASNEEILSFCQINFGVTFPMFAKIQVNGKEAHPLYQFLKEKQGGKLRSDIKWNFTKFLIDRNGEVVARFSPNTEPFSLESEISTLISTARL